jgi:hypothetical protein
MFATDQPPLAVACVALGKVGRLAKWRHPFRRPAQNAVAGNIREQQATVITKPDRPFDPVKPGGNALHGRIAHHISPETRVDDFKARHADPPLPDAVIDNDHTASRNDTCASCGADHRKAEP